MQEHKNKILELEKCLEETKKELDNQRFFIAMLITKFGGKVTVADEDWLSTPENPTLVFQDHGVFSQRRSYSVESKKGSFKLSER